LFLYFHILFTIDIKNVIPHGRKNKGTMTVTLSVAPDLTVGVCGNSVCQKFCFTVLFYTHVLIDSVSGLFLG